MDKRIADTYAKDSEATNRNKLYDVYVKAIRWASDRIGEKGVVAFGTNNGFLDGIAFDGMRKHLAQDFTKIYHIDFKGNARPSGERRQKEGGNIFDNQIRVGVGISLFIKKAEIKSESAGIWIYSVDDYLKAREKQELLTHFSDYTNVPIEKTKVDAKYTWLTEGLHTEFDTFIPMGTKQTRAVKGTAVGVVFKAYGIGVNTNRDAWVYNFNRDFLTQNMILTIETYNSEVNRWKGHTERDANIDDFVVSDEKKIKWSRNLRQELKRNKIAEYSEHKVRNSLYRPFAKKHLFFDRIMNNEVATFLLSSLRQKPKRKIR